jgi:mRNA interferase MazF
VVLLSRDVAYRVRTSITVAIVTRVVRNIPVEVPLGPEDGMPERCVVNLDVILTIPKAKLAGRITMLSPQKMTAIARVVIFALDLKV